MIRRPAVAGMFYSLDPKGLKENISNCFLHELGPGKLPDEINDLAPTILGLVVPHAGYTYSGAVAAHSYFELSQEKKPDVFIILGPNHTPLGSGISLMNSGIWKTPLGDVSIDSDVAEAILNADESEIIDVESTGHQAEHSIEVQLPFLQFLYKDKFQFVPISMMLQDVRTAKDVGQAIAQGVKNSGLNAVIFASTDFSHYEPHEKAQEKDRKAIDAILQFDEEGLYNTVSSLNISMCGYGPVMAMLTATKLLGAKEAKLLKYATSGDTSGNYGQVVGYAAIKISK
ncbi:MAG: AmmeMemoRadiSam system protein B [Promethearchaeota archaeon]